MNYFRGLLKTSVNRHRLRGFIVAKWEEVISVSASAIHSSQCDRRQTDTKTRPVSYNVKGELLLNLLINF